MKIVGRLPKFRAEQGEIWKNFETTFRLRTASSSLALFDVFDQKVVFLGCLEKGAARAHVLCGEKTQVFQMAGTLDALIEKVKNIFNPPQESELSMMEFERLRQSVNIPITTYCA